MVENDSSTASSSLHFARNSSWLTAVFANVLSYSIVVIPVILLVLFGHRWLIYLKLRFYCLYRCLLWLIGDSPGQSSVSSHKSASHHDGPSSLDLATCWTWPNLFRLGVCVTGLQLSFLSWGILQERMVTVSYGSQAKKFRDSLFLVFGNRSLAFIIALIAIWVRKRYILPKQTQHQSNGPISNVQPEIPFYCYLYASLSNIMGTWFQYEALKFVSFPLQVLSKTLKIIAVMLLGRCVQGKTYSLSQYLLAATVTLGVTLFLFGNEGVRRTDKHSAVAVTEAPSHDGSVVAVQLADGSQFAISLSGIILLAFYLVFDSFTSNWEERLFTLYPNLSSYEMMMGINCWGTILTTTALFVQGGFSEAWEFMAESKEFALHVVLLAVSSAVGSLFIYYTIASFGAVVFVSIMTVRQALAIFLSCIIYGHEITPIGMFGLVVVFISLGLQIALRRRKARSAVSSALTVKTSDTYRSQTAVPLLGKSEPSRGLPMNGNGNGNYKPMT